jgi:hypothetical protein
MKRRTIFSVFVLLKEVLTMQMLMRSLLGYE